MKEVFIWLNMENKRSIKMRPKFVPEIKYANKLSFYILKRILYRFNVFKEKIKITFHRWSCNCNKKKYILYRIVHIFALMYTNVSNMVKWDLWWTKWHRGRFSLSTSVSLAIHSTKFSILTITRGKYNRPVSGRRAEWTQFGLHPPLCKLKKNVSNCSCEQFCD
jgi:hypothetical protein